MKPHSQRTGVVQKTNGKRRWAASSNDHETLVTIRLLNLNGWQDTLDCLASVRRLDYPNYLNVVVEDGSPYGSAGKFNVWRKEKQDSNTVTADYNRETALAGTFLLAVRHLVLDV